MKSSLFTLGTAQLGLKYGVANQIGKPDLKQAFGLLDESLAQGIFSFDTAAAYGNSEEILGNYFYKNKDVKSHIITKLNPLALNSSSSQKEAVEQVDESLNLSFKRLKRHLIDTLLFHRFKNLTWSNYFLLNYLREKKNIKHIGVSVDSPEEAEAALSIDGISAIQLPTNLLDFRYIDKGILEQAEKKKIQVYIRSIFLQGLILMNIKNIPPYLKEAVPQIITLIKICNDHNISSIQELTFSFLKSLNGNINIIIGCETADQLKENAQLMKQSTIMKQDVKSIIFKNHRKLKDHILTPSLWKI